MMNEKDRIQAGTADAFLAHYNRQEGTSYRRGVSHSGVPDILARDEQREDLQIEVTMIEDRPGDIKAAFGRSETRSLESLRRHVEDVRAGRASPLDRRSYLSRKVTDLPGNVTDSLRERFREKLIMSYGRNTALVIRDTSRVDWDWDLVVPSLKEMIESILKERGLVENPYDKGIWIINRSKDHVFRII